MLTSSPAKRQPAPAIPQRSWASAYLKFLLNPAESLGLKLLPLVVIGVVPAELAGDVLLPFLAVIDGVPTALFALFVLWRTWLRVRTYR